MPTDIIITHNDLKDSAIDDVINLQRSLQNNGGERIEEIKTPFWLNPVFYYAVAATLGALAAWGLLEPFYNEKNNKHHIPFISDFILFGSIAGMLGLSLGCVYGVSNRNLKQTAYCALVGIGVGLGATILTTFIADVVFGLTMQLAAGMARGHGILQPGEFPFKGMSFFVLLCGRSIAWSIVATGAGLGLGIALKSKKLILNGFVGGLLGGLLGGLFFDPISRFVTHGTATAGLSRGVGFCAVGLLVGLFTGIFENLSKEAWFLMVKGPLAGKQFIIFKSPMLIGSSPKSDVYLFKDPDIAPQHATVVKNGSKYVLKDGGSEKGTFVNGKKIDNYILQTSDNIVIGETVLRYSEKQRA
jgi:hypothetical protein